MAVSMFTDAPVACVFGRSGYNKDDEPKSNKGRSGYNDPETDEMMVNFGRSGYNKSGDGDDDKSGRSGYN